VIQVIQTFMELDWLCTRIQKSLQKMLGKKAVGSIDDTIFGKNSGIPFASHV